MWRPAFRWSDIQLGSRVLVHVGDSTWAEGDVSDVVAGSGVTAVIDQGGPSTVAGAEVTNFDLSNVMLSCDYCTVEGSR